MCWSRHLCCLTCFAHPLWLRGVSIITNSLYSFRQVLKSTDISVSWPANKPCPGLKCSILIGKIQSQKRNDNDPRFIDVRRNCYLLKLLRPGSFSAIYRLRGTNKVKQQFILVKPVFCLIHIFVNVIEPVQFESNVRPRLFPHVCQMSVISKQSSIWHHYVYINNILIVRLHRVKKYLR